MTKIGIKKGGGGNPSYTEAKYGGPGQQTMKPGFGNLISTHGGNRNGTRRKGRRGGSTRISTTGGKRGSRKAKGGKRRRRATRGGCGCAGGTGETPAVAPLVSVSGGSAEPSTAVSSLLSGSVNA